jgi:hypothetical protein
LYFSNAFVRVLSACALAIIFCSGALGQAPAPIATRVAKAARTTTPPKIDGTLDDPAWRAAPEIDDLRQKEPLETEPATERTVIRVLYDSHHIYFGIRCYDNDPAGIVATQLRRDLSQDLDDNFAILIDPTLSHRNGYIFQVNPLGTQLDGEVIEEQAPNGNNSVVDPSWDGLWLSAAKIRNDGWTATIEIPFSTLNFRGGDVVSWGVNFRRFIRRKNEEDEWAGYRRVFGFWRVSKAGLLEGLTGIASSRLLVVKPYGLLGAQAFQGQPWSALHTGGFDVKYGLASNLIAVGTVNTDFSDADVDQQQFNLTPYPVFVPEKRRFFLEDSDIFNFLLWNQDLLFFTRQIGVDPATGEEVPIDAGGKIAGHAAGLDLGVMDVKTREEYGIPYANYAIARVKKALMPGSFVGAMVTDKQSGNLTDSFNRSAGIDAKFIFFNNLNLRGYYAKTWSPGVVGNNAAFGSRLTYANNWVNIYAGHGVTEKNFNAETGFVTRTDDMPTIVDVTFTPRPEIRGVREIDIGEFLTDDPNTAGHAAFREFEPAATVLFSNGAHIQVFVQDTSWQVLTAPLHLYKNIAVPAGDYRFASNRVFASSPGNHRLTGNGSFSWGRYFTGDLTTASLELEYRPNAHVNLAVNDTHNGFRLPQGNFDVELAGLQVSYAFNRFLNATTFIQTDTAQTQAVSANFRVRYTFRPDSDLYVIYNTGTRFQALAAGNPMNVRQQKFAIKITYSWSPRG